MEFEEWAITEYLRFRGMKVPEILTDPKEMYGRDTDNASIRCDHLASSVTSCQANMQAAALRLVPLMRNACDACK
jgi:hypothetical protein